VRFSSRQRTSVIPVSPRKPSVPRKTMQYQCLTPAPIFFDLVQEFGDSK
jgi:hypothetical protein